MTYVIDKNLLRLCEDVILNRREDAAERLVEYAATNKDAATPTAAAPVDAWRTESIEKRLQYAILCGIADFLPADINEALTNMTAMQIVEEPLMNAMGEVGERFGAGKMFLPQVVKSARILRMAVNILEPHLKAQKSNANANSSANSNTDISKKDTKRDAKKILLATVKGDVHDIGKNIVSIVLACNGFEIIDLGVMIPAQQILDGIKEHKPAMVGLSGLITPSLDEMENVAAQMNARGLDLPLLIGGATTTPLHTALHLDLAYPHRVFYVRDASQAAGIARQLASPDLKHTYTTAQQRKNEDLRRLHASAASRRQTITIDDARRNKLHIDWSCEQIPAMPHGINVERSVDVQDLRQYIDWSMFFYAWGFRGKYPEILTHHDYGAAVSQLFDEANAMLDKLHSEKSLQIQSVTGFFPAASEDEDILIYDDSRQDVLTKINTSRQLQVMKDGEPNLSLADFVASRDSGAADSIGMFVLAVQPSDSALLGALRSAGSEYDALLVETLCSRLAQAYAEYISVRLPLPCLRVAVGYSTLPDHSQKRTIFDLLQAEHNIGASLTESFMILPAAAECGLLMPNPRARYF
jgi:5-methyltetrahydrofolate--homocysteine methyltransferase